MNSTVAIGTAISPFELMTLPESLSVVNLCAHLAVFDLLTLMSRNVALESLNKSSRLCGGSTTSTATSTTTVFIQLLAKTLSVVVQCHGGGQQENNDQAYSPSAGVGERMATVIDDLAQREFVVSTALSTQIISILTNTACAF